MIYAVDQRRNVVLALSSLDNDATFMRLSPDAGAGPLQEPGGIALTADGHLVVADRGNDRVVVIDPDGGASVVLDPTGSPIGPLRRPTGVAVGTGGQIAVADTGNHRVAVFQMGRISGWSAFGVPGGAVPQGFEAPTAVLLDAADRILVADPGSSRLVRVDALDGSGWQELGLPPSANAPRPYALAAGPGGGALVTDLGNSRVVVLAADGSATVLIDGLADDGSIVAPAGASLSGGDLFVADAATCCITRWMPGVANAWSLAQRLDGRGGLDGSRAFSSLSSIAT